MEVAGVIDVEAFPSGQNIIFVLIKTCMDEIVPADRFTVPVRF